MSLGKILPFRKVVLLFFFGSMSLGTVLFIRAYTANTQPSFKYKYDIGRDEQVEKLPIIDERHDKTNSIQSGVQPRKTFLNTFQKIFQFNLTYTEDNVRGEEKKAVRKVDKNNLTSSLHTKAKQLASAYMEAVSIQNVSNNYLTVSQPLTEPIVTIPLTIKPPVPTINSKFSFYGEKGCRSNSLRGLFIDILSEWIKLAERENITYFLCMGSLLGQARDEDVIPYDLDVDVVVEIKDFTKLQKIAQPRGFSPSDGKYHLVVQPEFLQKKNMDDRKRFSCAGKVVPYLMDSCSFVEPMGRLVKNYNHVDIFTFIDKGDSVLMPVDYKDIHFKRDDIFPFHQCSFMGIKNVKCPRNIPIVLESIYGKNLAPSKMCRNGKWVAA